MAALTMPFSSSLSSFLQRDIYKSSLSFQHEPPQNISIRASSSSTDPVVTLLNYGTGNVRSVRNAICYLGIHTKDVQLPTDILNVSRLIVPSVGAFATAMDVLNKKRHLSRASVAL